MASTTPVPFFLMFIERCSEPRMPVTTTTSVSGLPAGAGASCAMAAAVSAHRASVEALPRAASLSSRVLAAVLVVCVVIITILPTDLFECSNLAFTPAYAHGRSACRRTGGNSYPSPPTVSVGALVSVMCWSWSVLSLLTVRHGGQAASGDAFPGQTSRLLFLPSSRLWADGTQVLTATLRGRGEI